MHHISAAILAGGKGRRIGGANKALLQLKGESFLRRITCQLQQFDEIILSTGDEQTYREANNLNNLNITVVKDHYKNCGPMSGLYSSLKACHSDWLFVACCDMPLLSKELVDYLISHISTDYNAFIAVTRDGRTHPYCGIYNKCSADIFKKNIHTNHLRIMDILSHLKVMTIPLNHTVYPDILLSNINTEDDYINLMRKIDGYL